jgi:hypothetical protein
MIHQPSRHYMNKINYYRRTLIKRGLTLIGGVFFLTSFRSSFGAAAKEPSASGKTASRARGKRQHCIEGVSLGAPVQYLENEV